MNSQEIQLHNAQVNGKLIRVEYSVVDDRGISNITQDISTHKLLPIVEEHNEYGEGFEFDYLADHLRKMVMIYLEREWICLS
jgi:hypothetical protein